MGTPTVRRTAGRLLAMLLWGASGACATAGDATSGGDGGADDGAGEDGRDDGRDAGEVPDTSPPPCTSAAECDDFVACTVDRCDSVLRRCAHDVDPAACGDGNYCNGTETCDPLVGCLPGTPVDCADGFDCTDDVCDPLTGGCLSWPDNSRCTAPRLCLPEEAGSSSGCAPPPSCAIDADCDNGNACDGPETCGAGDGRCRAGLPLSCADDLDCTVDACDPASGRCSHLAPDADVDTVADAECGGTDCDDHDYGTHPGAVESCDGSDEDCDTIRDDGATCPPATHASSACIAGACALTSCDPAWGNCNRNAADGCEASLATTTDCGSCGAACAPPHAVGSCTAGTCAVQSCAEGWGDCNAAAADGCETALTSLTDCGACGTPCSPPHAAEAICDAGRCTFSACAAGWGDCNLVAADGCETALDTLTDCGGCGIVCDVPHGAESCAGFSCVVGACDAGWADCDGSAADGCETSLSTLDDCGACDRPCSPPHGASLSCTGGACAYGACEPGWGDCDGSTANACESSLRSLEACGRCGTPCAPANAAGASCASGGCTYARCAPGWGDCDGDRADGCETSLDSPASCGGCGRRCELAHAVASCATGSCAVASCAEGWGDCNLLAADGCETSFGSLANCGGCGLRCDLPHAAEACVGGACTLGTCAAAWADCNGVVADGCETALNTTTDCGACDASCVPVNASGATCASGTCTFAACDPGWADCNGLAADGCEDALATLTDCGGCGVACAPAHATATCATGTCAVAGCQTGWGDCDGLVADGCEADLRSPTFCGASCGSAIDCTALPAVAGASCSAGTCVVAGCEDGRADCDDAAGNGCERNLDDGPGSCGGPSLGSVAGDAGADLLTLAGWGEEWLQFDVTEEDGSRPYLAATVTLDVPPDVDYDVYVRCGGSCVSGGPSGLAGPGADETVNVRWDNRFGLQDGRTVYVEVRFRGGGTLGCGDWTLGVRGNTTVGSATCP